MGCNFSKDNEQKTPLKKDAPVPASTPAPVVNENAAGAASKVLENTKTKADVAEAITPTGQTDAETSPLPTERQQQQQEESPEAALGSTGGAASELGFAAPPGQTATAAPGTPAASEGGTDPLANFASKANGQGSKTATGGSSGANSVATEPATNQAPVVVVEEVKVARAKANSTGDVAAAAAAAAAKGSLDQFGNFARMHTFHYGNSAANLEAEGEDGDFGVQQKAESLQASSQGSQSKAASSAERAFKEVFGDGGEAVSASSGAEKVLEEVAVHGTAVPLSPGRSENSRNKAPEAAPTTGTAGAKSAKALKKQKNSTGANSSQGSEASASSSSSSSGSSGSSYGSGSSSGGASVLSGPTSGAPTQAPPGAAAAETLKSPPLPPPAASPLVASTMSAEEAASAGNTNANTGTGTAAPGPAVSTMTPPAASPATGAATASAAPAAKTKSGSEKGSKSKHHKKRSGQSSGVAAQNTAEAPGSKDLAPVATGGGDAGAGLPKSCPTGEATPAAVNPPTAVTSASVTSSKTEPGRVAAGGAAEGAGVPTGPAQSTLPSEAATNPAAMAFSKIASTPSKADTEEEAKMELPKESDPHNKSGSSENNEEIPSKAAGDDGESALLVPVNDWTPSPQPEEAAAAGEGAESAVSAAPAASAAAPAAVAAAAAAAAAAPPPAPATAPIPPPASAPTSPPNPTRKSGMFRSSRVSFADKNSPSPSPRKSLANTAMGFIKKGFSFGRKSKVDEQMGSSASPSSSPPASPGTSPSYPQASLDPLASLPTVAESNEVDEDKSVSRYGVDSHHTQGASSTGHSTAGRGSGASAVSAAEEAKAAFEGLSKLSDPKQVQAQAQAQADGRRSDQEGNSLAAFAGQAAAAVTRQGSDQAKPLPPLTTQPSKDSQSRRKERDEDSDSDSEYESESASDITSIAPSSKNQGTSSKAGKRKNRRHSNGELRRKSDRSAASDRSAPSTAFDEGKVLHAVSGGLRPLLLMPDIPKQSKHLSRNSDGGSEADQRPPSRRESMVGSYAGSVPETIEEEEETPEQREAKVAIQKQELLARIETIQERVKDATEPLAVLKEELAEFYRQRDSFDTTQKTAWLLEQLSLSPSAGNLDVLDNIIMLTSSYKVTHPRRHNHGSETRYSYFVCHAPRSGEACFFGLQYYLKKYLVGPVVTAEKIDAAESFFKSHFSHPELGPEARLFDRERWDYIVRKHGGRLPIVIKSVPEGTVLPYKNVLFTVENSDPKCFWLTNYLEALLMQVWYPTMITTQSLEKKKLIVKYLLKTGSKDVVDDSLHNFKLHDFGFRGAFSVETSAVGGVGHLVNFHGSDTMSALILARAFYDSDCASYSLPIHDRSIIASRGREKEIEAIRNVLESYPASMIAVACDSLYGCLVIAPEREELTKTVLQLFSKLETKLGATSTSTGHKLLPTVVRIIQADGMAIELMSALLWTMEKQGWAADNVAFGSGGTLLQHSSRCTAQSTFRVTSGRRSKIGRTTLQKAPGGRWTTITGGRGESAKDELVEVFRNGKLLVDEPLEVIRQRALSAVVGRDPAEINVQDVELGEVWKQEDAW